MVNDVGRLVKFWYGETNQVWFCIVVWNPWEKKSKAIMDLGDEEYKQMVCVDGAAIEKPITLKPGEEWTGRLDLSVVPST